jgi:hypothetical protein
MKLIPENPPTGNTRNRTHCVHFSVLLVGFFDESF